MKRIPAILGLAAALFGGVAAGEEARSSASRGLERFFAPACAEEVVGIPMCVRAPAPGEPAPGPIGILLEDDAVIAACFDPDFPPPAEVIEAVNRVVQTSLRYNVQSSWPGPNNEPITLRWSFVPDGVVIPNGTGEPAAPSELFTQMDAKFGGNRALWIAQFEAVFARWSQLTGISYQRVRSGTNDWDDGASWGTSGSSVRGDVRIGMKPIDGGSGTLAYNSYPSGGDMVLDSAENWANASNAYRFLRNTISHEHGHGIGLAHVCPRNQTKLMEPFLNTNFDGPQQDEIRGAHRMYGDPYEPNQTAATATHLGVLNPGTIINPSLMPAPPVANTALTSIGINGDEDHYAFTANVPMLVTVTVTPVGSTYADTTQDSACSNSSITTDSTAQANLAVSLANSSGTALRTATSGGFSQPETLTAVLVSPPGDYTIRVYETSSPVESQLYSLVISSNVVSFTASDGSFSDRVRLSWSAVPTATNYRIFRGTSPDRSLATQLVQVAGAATQHDDLTAMGGVVYYYWLEAFVSPIVISRPVAGPETGSTGVPAPGNDQCAGAADIVPGAPVVFNNTGAGASGPLEPACFTVDQQVHADLWYRYTAQASGVFTVTTCGGSLDTRLAVYDGACPAAPDLALDCSDDSDQCGPGSRQSSVRVFGEEGLSYLIRVGGATPAAGTGQVQVFCAGDFNLSSVVSVQDIFDFLEAYFGGDPRADVNASGVASVQDIFDFLGAYFRPC